MYLKFTKNYLTIKKGRVLDIPNVRANILIEDKFAKEVDEKEYLEYVGKPEEEDVVVVNIVDTDQEKEDHLEKLGKMSLKELEDYCTENEVTIEVEEGASVEDVVTLIDLAEEAKKKTRCFHKGFALCELTLAFTQGI